MSSPEETVNLRYLAGLFEPGTTSGPGR